MKNPFIKDTNRTSMLFPHIVKSKLKGNKIKTEKELKEIISAFKQHKITTVFTNGCFDILHVGHIRYLQEAKTLGDVLIVAVNTDSSVKQFKGDKRPIVPEKERAEMVAALACVDFVVLFSDRLPSRILSELKPDIDVKGGDYTIDKMPEASVVQGYGGQIKILKEIKGKATTNIIKKVIEVYGDKGNQK